MADWAVVTGGGSGIGRALAIELASKCELHVLIIGRRLKPLRETASHVPERITVLTADVGREEDRLRVSERITTEKGRLKFLIHNAAVLQPVKPLSAIAPEEWKNHFAINVEGPLFLTQRLLPFMKKGSRILHISSGAAHHAYAGWGAYCAAKAALYALYRVWNLELETRGICVGSVRPGVVDTPMQNLVRQASPEVFPALDKFVKLKKEGQLLSPVTVARYIIRLLIETDDKTFASKEWDIRKDKLGT